MNNVNFADLDGHYKDTPPQLVGVYPLGGGGLVEAPYRHNFELRHLKKIVPFHKAMTVLELGSGNGRWAVSLAPLVSHYTGVDLTHEAIEISCNVVASKGITNVDFREMSILDFKGDRPYDFVYFSGVSQYLEDEEVNIVIQNLYPWFKSTTIIVDRSTVNYRQREILKRPNYYSVLRTPQELDEMFQKYGFSLRYYQRSYRFLRGAHFLRSPYLERLLFNLVQVAAPLSLHAMYAMSFLADCIHPVPFEGGDRDHDFLLFKKSDVVSD